MAMLEQINPGSWEAWAILALALGICEIFDGSGHVLSVGFAAGIMALASLCFSMMGLNFAPSWTVAVVEFGALAILSVFLLRKLRHGKQAPPDVNRY